MTILICSLSIFVILTYLIFFNPGQKWFGQLDNPGATCIIIWLIAGIFSAIGLLYQFGLWVLLRLALT